MQYTIIMNGISYDLPKKTLSIAEKLDRALKVDSVKGLKLRDKFEVLQDCANEVLGKDTVTEILGSDKLEEIDLGELAILVIKMKDAYEKPLNDLNAENSRRALNNMPINQITEIARASQSIAEMQHK